MLDSKTEELQFHLNIAGKFEQLDEIVETFRAQIDDIESRLSAIEELFKPADGANSEVGTITKTDLAEGALTKENEK